jgi:hypothetical protein
VPTVAAAIDPGVTQRHVNDANRPLPEAGQPGANELLAADSDEHRPLQACGYDSRDYAGQRTGERSQPR